ncbi:hypothetical protein [Streptomyces lanatus]|uniref:DUF5666 domain-containing protein n=1 Tax=Streptomyces lanatus TaxID=66900 RepID=A0ABV1Y318_9ACTN|nr:hypothetical protein [Streptomyces lanatus]GHH14011.1 hypothetical protein GCM10018780_54190 [Streptomyces lanatus]
MTHDPDHTHDTDSDFEVLTGRRPVRARTVTVVATAAVLALGGTVAYAATSSGSGGGASPAASGSPLPDTPGERHGPGPRFGLGGGGVHGESTVKDPDSGKWVVRIWQRGTIEKVDGDQVTVRSEDGAEWTWTVGSDTTVRHEGDKSSGTEALKKGEDIFVVGTRSDDDTRTASRVLAGDWQEWKKGKGRDGGPGEWRDKFGGPRHWDWRNPDPSESPSKSGAAT